MKEAEYSSDKYGLIHRGVSLLIIGGVVAYGIANGHLSIGRTIMYFIVPISCIWFPDAIATLKDDVISPGIIRFGGWCLLLIIIVYPFFLRLLTG